MCPPTTGRRVSETQRPYAPTATCHYTDEVISHSQLTGCIERHASRPPRREAAPSIPNIALESVRKSSYNHQPPERRMHLLDMAFDFRASMFVDAPDGKVPDATGAASVNSRASIANSMCFPTNGFTHCYLSFQSTFHLSLTVLVRYRSRLFI